MFRYSVALDSDSNDGIAVSTFEQGLAVGESLAFRSGEAKRITASCESGIISQCDYGESGILGDLWRISFDRDDFRTSPALQVFENRNVTIDLEATVTRQLFDGDVTAASLIYRSEPDVPFIVNLSYTYDIPAPPPPSPSEVPLPALGWALLSAIGALLSLRQREI